MNQESMLVIPTLPHYFLIEKCNFAINQTDDYFTLKNVIENVFNKCQIDVIEFQNNKFKWDIKYFQNDNYIDMRLRCFKFQNSIIIETQFRNQDGMEEFYKLYWKIVQIFVESSPFQIIGSWVYKPNENLNVKNLTLKSIDISHLSDNKFIHKNPDFIGIIRLPSDETINTNFNYMMNMVKSQYLDTRTEALKMIIHFIKESLFEKVEKIKVLELIENLSISIKSDYQELERTALVTLKYLSLIHKNIFIINPDIGDTLLNMITNDSIYIGLKRVCIEILMNVSENEEYWSHFQQNYILKINEIKSNDQEFLNELKSRLL
jgi:hypothetical protein